VSLSPSLQGARGHRFQMGCSWLSRSMRIVRDFAMPLRGYIALTLDVFLFALDARSEDVDVFALRSRR